MSAATRAATRAATQAATPAVASIAARHFFRIGAVSAAIAVATGAFGAHALRARIEPRLLEVFETGARYQMYHALALFAVAWFLERADGARATRVARFAGWAFIAGTVLFSGSLYALAITGIGPFGAITPLGGVCFLSGWVALARAAREAR